MAARRRPSSSGSGSGATALHNGERLGEEASLQISFLGEKLVGTGQGYIGPWNHALGAGWVRVAKRIAVPRGTRDAILTVGLLGAIGTLEIDGLTITEVPAGGAESSNLILNGDFELGDHVPTSWTVEESVRRCFPGRQSPSALELSGAGSGALNGLGVRVDRLRELEVRLSAKGTGLRRGAGGGRAAVFFRDADGRPLPPPDDGANLFRWGGTFDWKDERGTIRIPAAAVRAVLQIETLDAAGSLKIDDVVVGSPSDPDSARWTPYHVEDATDGWRPLPAAGEVAKGSALDASSLLEAPAGKRGPVVIREGRLHFTDGSRARFFGVVLLPPLAFTNPEDAQALADRLARSGVNLVRFAALDSPLGPGRSLYDDGRDDTLALDAEAIGKFDHLVAALKARGIYVALELISSRRFREGDGIAGWVGLPPGGGPAAAFDPKVRERLLDSADLLLGHVNPETKMALRDDPALAWVTLAGELSLLDRDDAETLPDEFEATLKTQTARVGAGKRGLAAIESSQWKAAAESLRKGGLKRPIAGSSHWRREPEFSAAQVGAGLDLVDDRLYWMPPRFGSPERRSMLFKVSVTMATEAARKRKADRPFVVGEWCAHTDGAWATPFEGADLMLVSRLATADDWDAICRRGIAIHPRIWGAAPAGSAGGSDSFAAPEVVNANPQVFALLPHAASVFLRGERSKKNSLTSWDSLHGRLVLDTPHTQGQAGWIARKPVRFDAVAIESETPYAVVMATSFGPQPLASASRILVTAVGRAEPTDLLYVDRWKREVASPGRGPMLVEPVRAIVTIRRKVEGSRLRPEARRFAGRAGAGPRYGGRVELLNRKSGWRPPLGSRCPLTRGGACGMITLVTGGAGFIGSHLVDRLLAGGQTVVALDNFDPFYPAESKRANLADASRSPRFRLVEGDIRDALLVERLIGEARPQAIVHLAARAGVRPSIDDPASYADVNVTGTVNLLQAACRLMPRPRFVYASSSSVYGDRADAPFRETDSVDLPVSPYAATKKACELLAHTFHHLHGLPVTGLRFFTAYGPRNRPDLAIAKFARLIETGQPVPMFGDGTTRRDYTYVGDIVDGIVKAIEKCRAHHLYNLGNSDPIELKEMIAAIGEALGRTPLIDRQPEQPGDVRQTFADISRAERELGYQPATPFRRGLASFVEWRRRNPVAAT